MQGINLSYDNLTGWDFSSQNLAETDLDGGVLTNATFSNCLANATLSNTLNSAAFTNLT